jgi:hypothetical protein
VIDRAQTIIENADARTRQGRKIIKEALAIMEMMDILEDDISDMTSRINFLEDEVSRHLPYLPDDFTD